MEKSYRYRTKGTCSQEILFTVRDGRLTDVRFVGGCNGNLQGISRLVEGMTPGEAASRLAGIRCGFKPTSCPDQFSKALALAIEDARTAENGTGAAESPNGEP